MATAKATTIDDYILYAPIMAQEKLHELRAILKEAAPNASEAIKWGNPVFEEKRILFAFAAFKTHLNFMPTPSGLKPFEEELTNFKTGKGSIQFPYDKPLPKELIYKIAVHRTKEVRENDAKWM
jgi:uncharacterized protein YdhG (YjbR/CyaY superfamily)